MENVINSWKGWRLEFEESYGSDCDGACEYSTYSTFDWTTKLEDIIDTGLMGWYTNKNGKYHEIYIEDIDAEKIRIHFTCGYDVTLSKAKPKYNYSFCYGRGDYEHIIRLVSPGAKEKEISAYGEPKFYTKCLGKLKPKEVPVPEKIGAVDLGLSVDWAPFDVGAEAPGEFGLYFAWGEIIPEKYGSEYHMGFNDENGKHIYDSKGNSLYDFSGRPEDDPATAHWGKGWRTPRKDEAIELLYSCELEWTKCNGQVGYRITGKTGKSIFMPVYKSSANLKERGSSSYWISAGWEMPGGSTKGETIELNEFRADEYDNRGIGDESMKYFNYIRPVKDKK